MLAPVRSVWAIVEDPELLAQWLSFCSRSQLIHGEGYGRVQRLYDTYKGMDLEFDMVVSEYVPEQRIVWRQLNEYLDGVESEEVHHHLVLEMEMAPAGTETAVGLTAYEQPRGWAGFRNRLTGSKQTALVIEGSLHRLGPLAARLDRR